MEIGMAAPACLNPDASSRASWFTVSSLSLERREPETVHWKCL